jgi:NTP pyrophosphatase (non-canonical NTP hydrolase)
MSDFAKLRQANEVRQREWDRDDKLDIAYRGNELAGEVGEACNIIKKLERERRGLRGSRSSIYRLAEELADVIICVDLIAMYENIDLWEEVKRKFNQTSLNNGLDARL